MDELITPFRLRYEFYCTVDDSRPTPPRARQARLLHGPPPPGECLQGEPCLESDHPDLRPGMTGHARVQCGKSAVGRVLGEKVLRFVRTEFWW